MAGFSDDEDVEFERGRASQRSDDSSSSRESSPRHRQKRSFSPNSDDGDLVVPPIADDDTPPPPERPIIRQAVAFSWTPTISSTPASNINTYQASSSSSSTSYFLPGQEVFAPPPLPAPPAPFPSPVPFPIPIPAEAPTPSAPSLQTAPPERPVQRKRPGPKPKPKNLKNGSSKAAQESEGYSAQTTRFRIKEYDHTRAVATPPRLQVNKGPYSSTYRATTRVSSVGSASPTPTLVASSGPSGSRDPTRRSAQYEAPTNKRPKTSTSGNKAFEDKPTSSKASGSQVQSQTERPAGKDSKRADASGGAVARRSGQTPQNESHSSGSPAPPSRHGSSYYRRDYEINDSSRQAVAVPVQQRPTRPLRMVTILIEDIRSGIPDHQLAEVKVPLREADDPQDGYWADAKDICDMLQASPSRIDGPAKVFTLRGKYRQIFLRVSAQNEDECTPANIVINPDRTLEVVVELNPSPGMIPLPSRIGGRQETPSRESDNFQVSASTRYPFAGSSTHNNLVQSGKRRHSPSFDDYDNNSGGGSWTSSSRSFSPYDSPSQLPDASGRSMPSVGDENSLPEQLQSSSKYFPPPTRRGYESPDSDEESDSLHKKISAAVDQLLQKDEGWLPYFRALAKPIHVPAVLDQYRFIDRMMNTWVGRGAPFRNSEHIIEKSHIITALRVEFENPEDRDKLIKNCPETLRLLSLYGHKGERLEDPRVVQMVNDHSAPEYNAKPIKRLLRLLREIDENWVKEHPASDG